MWRWLRELFVGPLDPPYPTGPLPPAEAAPAYYPGSWDWLPPGWRELVILLASGRAPGGLSHAGKLSLAGLRLRSLPSDLSVDGNLDLRQSQRLQRIGDGLTVGGRLEIGGAADLHALPWRSTILKASPEARRRFWSAPIFARPSRDGQCPIEALPARLGVGGDLVLRACRRLATLPHDMDVGGSISLEGCSSLERLPDPFEVLGSLAIIGAPRLLDLPSSLTIGGSLCLVGVGIASLPAGLRVGGDLTLQGCARLDRLPDGLTVGGSLILRACPVARLPDGLRVGRDLVCDRLRELSGIPSGFSAPGRTLFDRCPRL
ncbi:hypothetical protein [Paludisphaera sp.]|uniref:hypothetical protein n=1 Tax=Paludisphaera sp. TaxID=2017432 RepID=UPI00301C73C1